MINLSATAPARHWLVPVLFALVLLLGLRIYRDYGLSIDENQSHDNGMISLKHVAQKINQDWVTTDPAFDAYQVPLADHYDRDYGVAFEMPVTFLERLLHYNNDVDKFMLRHLCTFLACFAGLIAMYQLAARRFRDWRLGLLAAGWLLISPRLFADYFYNDKDAVFMAFFAIATNTGVRLLLRPTVGRAIWHALACAITIDVRIMGIIIPLATVALLGWRGVWAEVRWVRVAGVGVLYTGLTTGLVVLFWPYLWPAPWHNFVLAFQKMSAFRWGGTVLYQGKLMPATDLPWHYALVWIGITTPLLYLASGLVGTGLVLRQLVRQRWKLWHNEGEMQDILFLGLFAGPLLAVIALHSVLYDGWRQLYFVYPAFLLLAVRGWTAMAAWRARWAWWPKAVAAATVLSFVLLTAQMVRDHPMQNVYFNLLAGTNVGERFEMDYWGVGYREDLQYIADHDTRDKISIYAPGPSPAGFNAILLPPFQSERLVFTYNADTAHYFISNYRWHPEPYPYKDEVFQLMADGRRVHSVFRLR